MDEANLQDIYRIQNPESKQYTWFRYNPTPQFSRLDFFLISNSLVSVIEWCQAMQGFISDHSFIEMDIDDDDSPRGKGF